MDRALKDAYAGKFRIGAATGPSLLAHYADMLEHHFNSITAENCMKPLLVQPREGEFTFSDADALADFARARGIGMRGHTLLWHQQSPDWFFEDGRGGPAPSELVLERLREHIRAVVARYRDVVYAWDVVNEAVQDGGLNLLRKTKWYDALGEDYLLEAYRAAGEAAPDAVLVYNDYNECDAQKRERICRLVGWMLERGAPVHAVGMQGHWGLTSPSLAAIRESIEAFAALGLGVQVTELDISMYEWSDGPSDAKEPTTEMLARQAERYDAIFRLFREYAGTITGVTFWGIADDHTWLDNFPVKGRKNWPFLFDTAHQPKESFRRVMGV